MNRTCVAVATAFCAVLFGSRQGLADDHAYIWQPTKNSDTSYMLKMGVKLPTEFSPQAGVDLGLDAARDGSVIDTPVRFWTTFKTDSVQRPGYQMNRKIAVSVDGNVGSAGVSMTYYKKEIVTDQIDLEHQSVYGVAYDGNAAQWAGFNASQSVKFIDQTTDTAFVFRASGSEDFSIAGGGLGIEQKLGDHITLSGSWDRYSNADAPVASVNARYDYKW